MKRISLDIEITDDKCAQEVFEFIQKFVIKDSSYYNLQYKDYDNGRN